MDLNPSERSVTNHSMACMLLWASSVSKPSQGTNLTELRHIGGRPMSLISAVAKRTKSLIVIVSMILLLPGLVCWSGSERFSSESNALAAPQRVLFSTYLGGQDTQTSGIAIDRSGHLYVTGVTESPAFPLSTTSGSPTTSLPRAFVTKISPASGSIVYSTLIPGTTGAAVAGIAVGDDDAVYITGTT